MGIDEFRDDISKVLLGMNIKKLMRFSNSRSGLIRGSYS
jgi:hypothetical protein